MICPSCRAENDPAAPVCFHCRTVLVAVSRGTVVGTRYEVLSLLGSGGMGTVYKVRDRVLDEIAALKVLRGDVAATAEMAERFRSEIKLARRVTHPNVCRIHDYGEDERLRYISMELIEGPTLKEVLTRRGGLPAGEAFDLAIQVAHGLEAIHGAGIVHRDLKSLNVMIDGRGSARVMDFGIAKRLAPEEGGGADSSGYVMGTPEYMSPEQARGRPVDVRSDVYALGVLAFELFTGRVPFRADTPVGTLLLHLEAPPPLEGPAASGIPAAAIPVLRRALAKEPAERHASTREAAEALSQARRATLGDAGLGASAPLPTRRLAPRRSPRLVLALALGGLAAGALWVAWPRPEPAAPPPVGSSPQPASPTTPPPGSTLTEPEPSPGATPAHAPPPEPPRARESLPPGDEPERAAVPTALSPTAAPPASPSPAPSAPEPTAPAAPEPEGGLAVNASPWADVVVDGRAVGQTPLQLRLPPGPHSILLVHPDYQPWPRRVVVTSGETLRLSVHFPTEGIRRR